MDEMEIREKAYDKILKILNGLDYHNAAMVVRDIFLDALKREDRP